VKRTTSDELRKLKDAELSNLLVQYPNPRSPKRKMILREVHRRAREETRQ
jgi:hypothetical protein